MKLEEMIKKAEEAKEKYKFPFEHELEMEYVEEDLEEEDGNGYKFIPGKRPTGCG